MAGAVGVPAVVTVVTAVSVPDTACVDCPTGNVCTKPAACIARSTIVAVPDVKAVAVTRTDCIPLATDANAPGAVAVLTPAELAPPPAATPVMVNQSVPLMVP